MNEPSPIPVVLCVDAEPDRRVLDPRSPSPWRGFWRTFALLDSFRKRAMARADGALHFSWYVRMDPQIAVVYGSPSWAISSHASLVRDLSAAGDHVGLHVHACRWDDKTLTWSVDYGDAVWIDHCLDTAFSAFEASLGRTCTTFRFGDRWMDDRVFRRLQTLGVEVDLTIEPGQNGFSYAAHEKATGALPDYRHAPTYPYRPSAHDYRVADAEGPSGIWELPVTTAHVQPRLAHRLYRRWIGGNRETAASTALVSAEPLLFRRIVDDALARPRPYLVLPLRTGAAEVPRYAARVHANLSTLLEDPRARRFAWVSPAAAIQLLQQ